MLGHVKASVSETYAIPDPANLGLALAVTEPIIDEIEQLPPGASYRSITAEIPKISVLSGEGMADLCDLECGAGEGNRTLVVSLGSFCSTIELHPHINDLALIRPPADLRFTIPVCRPACDPTAECHIPGLVVNVDRSDPPVLVGGGQPMLFGDLLVDQVGRGHQPRGASAANVVKVLASDARSMPWFRRVDMRDASLLRQAGDLPRQGVQVPRLSPCSSQYRIHARRPVTIPQVCKNCVKFRNPGDGGEAPLAGTALRRLLGQGEFAHARPCQPGKILAGQVSVDDHMEQYQRRLRRWTLPCYP